MIDHVGIQLSDVDASVSFYANCFAAIGMHDLDGHNVEAVHHGF